MKAIEFAATPTTDGLMAVTKDEWSQIGHELATLERELEEAKGLANILNGNLEGMRDTVLEYRTENQKLKEGLWEATSLELQTHQPCGCQVCICSGDTCLGCGAKNCYKPDCVIRVNKDRALWQKPIAGTIKELRAENRKLEEGLAAAWAAGKEVGHDEAEEDNFDETPNPHHRPEEPSCSLRSESGKPS